MILDDSPAFHATFLGAMRIGAVPVPVNPMDRPDNYPYYLADSYSRVAVVDSALLDTWPGELGDVHILTVGATDGRYPDFSSVISERAGELPPPADTHAADMAFWLYS